MIEMQSNIAKCWKFDLNWAQNAALIDDLI